MIHLAFLLSAVCALVFAIARRDDFVRDGQKLQRGRNHRVDACSTARVCIGPRTPDARFVFVNAVAAKVAVALIAYMRYNAQWRRTRFARVAVATLRAEVHWRTACDRCGHARSAAPRVAPHARQDAVETRAFVAHRTARNCRCFFARNESLDWMHWQCGRLAHCWCQCARCATSQIKTF